MTFLNELKREVSGVRFSRSALGYKALEVDSFIDSVQKKIMSVIDEYDKISKENEGLRAELLELKNAQESVTRAIANSERIAQASVIDAGVKSKYILKDASEKAASMIKTANDEYKKKMDEAIKLRNEINIFVDDCIKKFETQVDMLKKVSNTSVSKLDLKEFQVDEFAKQFIEETKNSDDEVVFSDGSELSVDKKGKKGKYDNLQFGADFKRF